MRDFHALCVRLTHVRHSAPLDLWSTHEMAVLRSRTARRASRPTVPGRADRQKRPHPLGKNFPDSRWGVSPARTRLDNLPRY
jgi:hypothetical protein